MTYSIVTIRERDSGDDALYPTVNLDATAAELSREDGRPDRLTAKTIEIFGLGGKNHEQILNLDEIKADVLVTDARVVVSCKKYDKGGGWRGMGIGGVALMAVANSVSKARAAGRRRGNCLVAHIRYPWLAEVGYLSKAKMFGRTEQIRMLVADGTSGTQKLMALDLTFGIDVSARKVAGEILERAAKYRLENAVHLADEEIAELVKARKRGMPGGNDGSKFTLVSLPGTKVVRSSTARYPEKDPEDQETEAPPAVELEAKEERAAEPQPIVSETEAEQPATSEAALAKFCFTCGNAFDTGEMFCTSCGGQRRKKGSRR